MSDLSKFIASNLFETKMSANGLDGWSNYAGPDWSGWLCGLGYNRDSDVLDQSNFDTALERLGGEVEDQVEVRDVGHWACGWFKQIMVNVRATKQVEILASIYSDLESYPVLDEDDFSEREHEQRCEWAEQEKDSLASDIEEVFNVKSSKKLIEICFELNMECQSYYGDDSSINVSTYHGCDSSDIDRIKTCLKQLEYNYSKSTVFKKLVKAVNAYQPKVRK